MQIKSFIGTLITPKDKISALMLTAGASCLLSAALLGMGNPSDSGDASEHNRVSNKEIALKIIKYQQGVPSASESKLSEQSEALKLSEPARFVINQIEKKKWGSQSIYEVIDYAQALDPFLALAMLNEGIGQMNKGNQGSKQNGLLPSYMDKGLNIGFGYNVNFQVSRQGTKNKEGRTISEQKTYEKLVFIGVKKSLAEQVVKNPSAYINQVPLTLSQSVKLLDLAKQEFEKQVKVKVGGDNLWQRLRPNEQAALVYVGYNTGWNLKSQKSLVDLPEHLTRYVQLREKVEQQMRENPKGANEKKLNEMYLRAQHQVIESFQITRSTRANPRISNTRMNAYVKGFFVNPDLMRVVSVADQQKIEGTFGASSEKNELFEQVLKKASLLNLQQSWQWAKEHHEKTDKQIKVGFWSGLWNKEVRSRVGKSEGLVVDNREVWAIKEGVVRTDNTKSSMGLKLGSGFAGFIEQQSEAGEHGTNGSNKMVAVSIKTPVNVDQLIKEVSSEWPASKEKKQITVAKVNNQTDSKLQKSTWSKNKLAHVEHVNKGAAQSNQKKIEKKNQAGSQLTKSAELKDTFKDIKQLKQTLQSNREPAKVEKKLEKPTDAQTKILAQSKSNALPRL